MDMIKIEATYVGGINTMNDEHDYLYFVGNSDTIHGDNPFVYDGKTLTKAWFVSAVNGSQKIALIKLCRTLSGMGLKEAKDGVENNCVVNLNVPMGAHVMDLQKTTTYFSKWLKTKKDIEASKKTPEQIKAETQDAEEAAEEAAKAKDAEETSQILNGLNAACMDWKYLGYKNKYDACRMVLSNYQNMEEDN